MTMPSLIKHKDNLLASMKCNQIEEKPFLMSMIYLNLKEIYLKKASSAVYAYRELCDTAMALGWAKSNQDFFQQMIANKLIESERHFQTDMINRMVLLKGKNIREDFPDTTCDKLASLLVSQVRDVNIAINTPLDKTQIDKKSYAKACIEAVQCLFNLYQLSVIHDEGEPAIINKIIQKSYALCASETEQKNLQHIFTTDNLKSILAKSSLDKSAYENETLLNNFQYLMLNEFKSNFLSEKSHIREFNDFIQELKNLANTNVSKEKISQVLNEHEAHLQVLYENDENDYCLSIEKSFAASRQIATTLLLLIENEKQKPWIADLRRALGGVFSEIDEQFRVLKKIVFSDNGTEKEIANHLKALGDIQPLFADMDFNPLNHPVVKLIFSRQFSEEHMQVFHAMFEDNASMLKLTYSAGKNGMKI